MARILIIEDSPVNMELMTYLLERHGHTVINATDGELGVAVAASQLPDLIICDIQMRGLDGYQVAQALKSDEKLKNIPLLAVTALAMTGDRERAMAVGFDSYFSKPVDPVVFIPQIEKFLPESLRTTYKQAQSSGQPAQPTEFLEATILVVDNLRMNLDLAVSLLGGSGYNVVTASGMAQALTVMNNIKPDLILSDVLMQEADGFDFIKFVKNDPVLESIPFAFITSTAITERERRTGLALGAIRFLVRPLDAEELLSEIKTCLLEADHIKNK
ncbi:MAG: response regulator [Pseudohongiellaceae bacterium]